MRAAAFCLVREFPLQEIYRYFKAQGYQVEMSRRFAEASQEVFDRYIVIFSSGCIVYWNVPSYLERKFNSDLLKLSVIPANPIEQNYFIYRYGHHTNINYHKRFNLDIITLASKEKALKFAVSYGLAQAVKMDNFETTLEKTVAFSAILPYELAKRGKIRLSRRAITQRIGEIFLVRSSINLYSEFFDTPDFFWQDPSLEDDYYRIHQYLEISNRAAMLNQKLDVLQGILDILNNELQHRHSSMLEMIIILLIAFEIVMNSRHWFS